MKPSHVLFSLVIILSVLGLSPSRFFAQDTPAPEPLPASLEITFKDLVGSDVSLQGLLSGYTVWVDLPYNWTIKNDIIITLSYYASEELDVERASITVLVNGVYLTSIQPVNNQEWQTVTFAVPSDLVYQGAGFNLEFQGYLRLTDLLCEEPQIPAQWFKLGEISRISLMPDTTPQHPVLEQAVNSIVPVSPFLRSEAVLVFVVPEVYDRATMSVVTQIAARIGRESIGKFPKIEIRTPATLTDEDKNNAALIIAGTPENNPLIGLLGGEVFDGTQFFTLDGLPVDENDGVIGVIPSPFNSQHNILIASGMNSNALSRVAAVFGRKMLFDQLNGWVQFVADVSDLTPVASDEPWTQAQTTFSQLGFLDRSAFGTASTTLSYGFQRPYGYRFAPDSSLMLNLAFSPLSVGSNIAVYLNGIYLGLVEINRDISERQFTFALPTDDLNQFLDERPLDLMNLQLVASNVFPVDHCQQLSPQVIWSRVESDSAFTLTTIPLELPNLGEFPYPYLNKDTQTKTIFVLPDAPQTTDLELAIFWAMKMGRGGFSDFDIHTITTSELDGDLQRENLIIFGDTARQPLTMPLVEALPQTQKEGLYNAIGENNAGIIRQFISPYNNANVITLVYGDTLENYLAAATTFIDRQLLPVGALLEVSAERLVVRLAEETDAGAN